MPFSWLQANVNSEFTAKVPTFAEQMHVRMIRERAGILVRLGTPKDVTIARCKQYMTWEFEKIAQPKVLAQIEAIVDQVYTRAGKSK